MKKKAIINFTAPVILFVFVTFSYIDVYIIDDTRLYIVLHNLFSLVVCVGLGLLAGYILKTALFLSGQRLLNSDEIRLSAVFTSLFVSAILMCLFMVVFEYPDVLVRVSKALCFIFIAFFISGILRKYILEKNNIGVYIISGVLSSLVITLLAVICNSWWHYLSYNMMFDFVDPVPFSHFITYDIAYKTGLIGAMRYPLLLVIVLAFFLINVFLHKNPNINHQ